MTVAHKQAVAIDDDFYNDNTDGMDRRLARFYRHWIPVIQAELYQYFPRVQTKDWLVGRLGPGAAEIAPASIQKTLVDPTYLYIDRPGKLLRPILTALILEAYGADVNRYKSVLATIELMEVTTISMNDIWDDSLYRRAGYCTHVVHSPEIAHAAALAGYAYSLAFLFDDEYGLDTHTALRLYRAFAFEDIQLFLGDVVETMWPIEKREVIPEAHFFQEVASRCAFLSFRGPARIGAILGGADDEDIARFERFGMLIGLAYHLRGDNLNVAPQSVSWGKQPYEDITAGRRSLLTSFAIQDATPADRREMLDILDARTIDPSRIERFIELLRRYGAADRCERRADELLREARASLEATTLGDDHKELLWAFAEIMVKRKK